MANTRKAKKAIFTQNEHFSPRNEKEVFLINALLTCKNQNEMADFLRDLLTVEEIEEFSKRLEIVRLLAMGLSYLEVAEKTGSSTSTVSRVSHWYFSGCGGYARVITRLINHE